MSSSYTIPETSNPELLREFRRVLQSAGYHTCGIAESLEASGPVPPMLDDESPPTPLNTLLRLFDRETSVTAEAAASAFSPLTVTELARAGFVRQQGRKVSSTVRIEPYGDLLLAHPWGSEGKNAVMSISRSSLELAHFTVRSPFRKTLDLGTGSGLQAILAASHSEQVHAIDVNPLAVKSAEFNCFWNGIGNVVCLQGNLFDPLATEKFDLIVTNPPFVISPSMQVRFRDSGVRGDQFCVNLAREAAGFLNEGSYFQMVFQWIETAGQDWRDKLSCALSGLGCDVWVMRIATISSDLYVWSWVEESAPKTGHKDVSRLDWLRYLDELGVQSIGSGLLTLQRASQRRNCLWFDESPEERSQPYGTHIPVVLAIRHFLQDRSDSSLLQEKLVASPYLRMIQESRLRNRSAEETGSDGKLFNAWQPARAEFELEKGIRYFFDSVDPLLAGLVSGCDGQHHLREIFEAAAAENKLCVSDLTAKYLGQIRELIHYAFLMPTTVAGSWESKAQSV